jgi:NAD(P)-dependent dehydrogenase (short-subunit alcohol dehydrogenase family)
MRFKDKRAVVTGAASGLGRAVARRLAAEGAAFVALIDRDGKGLAETATGMKDAAVPFVCDVSNPKETDTAWAEIGGRGGIEVLVTAAGILGPACSVAECEPDDWDQVFAVNVRGTYLAVRAAVPLMRRGGGGAIVTFGSTAGLAGSSILGPYSASKGAVVLMTRSLAHSLAPDGIRVNCVCPGSIETPMLDATFASAGDAAARNARAGAMKARHPIGRFGKAEEVAAAVLFLASDEASFMTGVAMPVDGGRLA